MVRVLCFFEILKSLKFLEILIGTYLSLHLFLYILFGKLVIFSELNLSRSRNISIAIPSSSTAFPPFHHLLHFIFTNIRTRQQALTALVSHLITILEYTLSLCQVPAFPLASWHFSLTNASPVRNLLSPVSSFTLSYIIRVYPYLPALLSHLFIVPLLQNIFLLLCLVLCIFLISQFISHPFLFCSPFVFFSSSTYTHPFCKHVHSLSSSSMLFSSAYLFFTDIV